MWRTMSKRQYGLAKMVWYVYMPMLWYGKVSADSEVQCPRLLKLLPVSKVWSNPWEGNFFVISTSTMASAEETSSMFDFNQSHKPVPKGFNFDMLAKPELWHMKPYDTKHPEISGAPFPLALYDGSLNGVLIFWKILEWRTESTPL